MPASFVYALGNAVWLWNVVLEVAALFAFCFHWIVLFSFFSFLLRNCAVRTGYFNGCFGGQSRLNGKLGTSLAEKGACLDLYMLPLYAAPRTVWGQQQQNDHIKMITSTLPQLQRQHHQKQWRLNHSQFHRKQFSTIIVPKTMSEIGTSMGANTRYSELA